MTQPSSDADEREFEADTTRPTRGEKALSIALIIGMGIPLTFVLGDPLYAAGVSAGVLFVANWALWRYRVVKLNRRYLSEERL